MSNHDQIQNLINQISAISKQYEKIAELTGENFNVFKVLGLTTNEVRTHSAFITELFNPKGSHGQKEVFLKLFCDQLEIKNFNYEKATAIKEKYINYISEDYTEGGNIDIIVTDDFNRAIIIENKIYARDQKCQLLRYYNYGKSNHDVFTLFYLTLDKKDATEWSISDLKENDYKKISYSDDILPWLEKCKEKSVNHPILRETLTQYIHLVNYLTEKAINNNMTKEIVEKLAKSAENIDAAYTIYASIFPLTLHLISDFKCQIKGIANAYSLIVAPDHNSKFENRDADGGVYFYPKNWKKFQIGFCFEKDGSNGFYYGICRQHSDIETPQDVIELIQKAMQEKPNDDDFQYRHWHWFKYFEEPYKDWGNNNSKPWCEIANGEMKKKIEEKVNDILNKTQGKDWF